MAVTIKRGSTEEARKEYTCYYQAFWCMQIEEDADAVTVWTFDEDSTEVWKAMEHNTVTEFITGPAAVEYIMNR